MLLGVVEEERKKGAERLLEEIMSENFSNFMKDMIVYIQEAQKTLSRIDSKRSTSRHVINCWKPKTERELGENLVCGKRKLTCHIQGILSKMNSEFLIKTTEARRLWEGIF